jgi:hypothetical protein
MGRRLGRQVFAAAEPDFEPQSPCPEREQAGRIDGVGRIVGLGGIQRDRQRREPPVDQTLAAFAQPVALAATVELSLARPGRMV